MAFREWVKSVDGLEQSGPLEGIKDTALSIDAEDYLHNILNTTITREPLLPAHGGFPFALQKHVDRDLQCFRDAEITPHFIFNGLDVAGRDHATISRESNKAVKVLNEAWTIYDQGRGEEAVAAFGKACTYKTYHIARWLFFHLRKAGVFVQVAPYYAAAQIAYMYEIGYVDGVCGSASCLLFGCDQVITSFDWETKTFTWVETQDCQDKLRVSRETFVDLMLLSGLSTLPPIAQLLDEDSPIARVAAVRQILSHANGDGWTACLQLQDEAYAENYMKQRTLLKHPILILGDGTVTPKDPENMPNDVHEFTSQRLPDELIHYLARGVVGPRVLNARVRMELFETQPLDGGASPAYKELVSEKLRPLRAQSLGLITRLLHRYYQKTDVDLVCWYNEANRRPLGVRELTETSEAEKSWHVKPKDMPTVNGVKSLTAPLLFAVEALSEDAKSRGTVTPRKQGTHSLVRGPENILANSVWRFMHDRGYINNDHTLSAWGKALKASLDHAKGSGLMTPESGNEAEEAIFVAFELLRLNILNSASLFPTPPYTGAPSRGTDADKANTLLISRIACLGTFGHSEIGYTGPLSRHLLAYHQMIAAVRGSLRDLAEMHACTLLLSGAVARDIKPNQLTELGAAIPFAREPDLGLALVVKSYLDELSNDPARRSDISRWFIHAKDIHQDLEKAFKLWNAVSAGVQAADSSIVNNETRRLFKSADEWLQAKRPATNGSA